MNKDMDMEHAINISLSKKHLETHKVFLNPTKKEEMKMAEVEMPHPGHERHLCYLQNIGYLGTNVEEYKEMIKNTKFFCKNCGRAAADDKNLCEPERL
jgi:hypothetical protein